MYDRPEYASNEVATQEKGNNKIRPINIEELDRGFIVSVGCHRFAISSKEEMIEKLLQYINEPQATEVKWYKNELFK